MLHAAHGCNDVVLQKGVEPVRADRLHLRVVHWHLHVWRTVGAGCALTQRMNKFRNDSFQNEKDANSNAN